MPVLINQGHLLREVLFLFLHFRVRSTVKKASLGRLKIPVIYEYARSHQESGI